MASWISGLELSKAAPHCSSLPINLRREEEHPHMTYPESGTEGYNEIFYEATKLGGFCTDDLATVVLDKPGDHSRIQAAVRNLAKLLGAVRDGDGPSPGNEVPGSDGAEHCPDSDGYVLSSSPGPQNGKQLSACVPEQLVYGFIQRDAMCWNNTTTQPTKRIK
ncbi:uncharacterized protein LOC125939909 [Dermacentor silvarum]|uniref:uncharacterized protein LOC125939909 n=1 Tax=Dermacentor silvarum TaxID=543639 RepID=UPI0021008A92|nr:uncharacterized protein LOC125939909 [Dermacentor silvarum]